MNELNLELKMAAVSEFLKERFPSHHVYNAFDPRRSSEFYRIEYHGQLRHLVFVSKEFFDDHTEDDILRLLEDWTVVDIIRQAGLHSVFITNQGAGTETEAG